MKNERRLATSRSLFSLLGAGMRPTLGWWRTGTRDLKLVARRLRKTPLFAMATVGTLTVGLGAFAVVYTAVDKILLEPMPYAEPGDVYFVWRDATAYGGPARGQLEASDVVALQRAGGLIEDAAGLRFQIPTLSAGPGSDTLQVTVMEASPNLFKLLGVSPAIGRGFDAKEVAAGGSHVVILSDALWRRLGADASILGTDIGLGGSPYTVIGVMPPNFPSPGGHRKADLYRPLPFDLTAKAAQDGPSYLGLVRARHGASPEAVAAEVGEVGRLIDERDNESRGLKLNSVGLQEDLVAAVRTPLVVLALSGVLLLIVLMVNLASLLLARTAQREREFAISRALGANGITVVRATLLEGGLLGLVGGVTGTIAGIWATRLLVALAPLDLPRRANIELDWKVAAIVIGVGVCSGLMAAFVPSVWAARASLASVVGATTLRGAGGAGRMRRSLIVAQVALSLVLLSTGALVVRSFAGLVSTDPGFRSEGVLTFFLNLSPFLPDPNNVFAFEERLEKSLEALPGVTGASATWNLPLSGGASMGRLSFPGAPGNTGDSERDRPLVDFIATRGGYVKVMGMRLVAGREFSDAPSDAHEALIDRHLAEQFFPTGSPLGATIRYVGVSLTVVGVVEQARIYDVYQDGRPQLYGRIEDLTPFAPYYVVLRTEREPQALVPEVRAAVRKIDPRVAVSQVRTMDEIVADSLSKERISAVLIGGFALGALLLVATGLFGVVSGSVVRRRGELAVRMALGATHNRVRRLVVGEGLRLVVLGFLVGIPGVYLSGRVIQGILIEVSPFDIATLAAVAGALAAVTLLSCYLAVCWSTAIEPASLLREAE